MSIILLSIFGVLGVLSRYTLDTFFNTEDFPIGTLSANLLGCLLAGIIFQIIQTKSSDLSQLFLIGFCGALTTFSSYALQGFQFLQKDQTLKGFFYLFGSPLLGVLFIFLGIKIFQLSIR